MLASALGPVVGHDVPRETLDRLELYCTMLLSENKHQNLISKSSVNDLLQRHIADSAQLVRFAEGQETQWVDIGSGPGLPGIVIAILTEDPMTLVEPRPLRTRFLARVVARLDLRRRVKIVEGKASDAGGEFDIITGRAVASLSKFLTLSRHLSTRKTRWVLPKGRKAAEEVALARKEWQGDFELEPSLTDADARIVLVRNLRRRGQ